MLLIFSTICYTSDKYNILKSSQYYVKGFLFNLHE